MNPVGTFGLCGIKSTERNQTKVKVKLGFLRKISFDKISFGFWCNSKTNDRIVDAYNFH